VSGNQIDEQKWQDARLDVHLQKPLTIDAVLSVLEENAPRNSL
jgi:hypothetical protein